ncbi:hypothetical protein ACFPVT_05885 [Corynebacterium choanae]|nr:hypothetical protein [Corynebacterium choanae]
MRALEGGASIHARRGWDVNDLSGHVVSGEILVTLVRGGRVCLLYP